jgi:hypothetical protein
MNMRVAGSRIELMNAPRTKKLAEIILISAALALFFYLRILNINRPFWKDEQTSMETLATPVLQNPLFFGVSTNLPFFYYTLKVYSLFSKPYQYPALVYRILPLVFNLATLLYLYFFISKHLGKVTALLFAFLFSAAPLQVYYSLEFRAYSLTQLLLAVQTTQLYAALAEPDLRRAKKAFGVFVVFALLVLLTHYAGYIVLGAEVFLILLLAAVGRLKPSIGVSYFVIGFGVLTTASALILYAVSRNPHFLASIGSMDLGNTKSAGLLSLFSLTSLSRLKEVVTFYYWYGLNYYYADPWVQYLVKKVLALVIVVGVYLWVKDRNKAARAIVFASSTVLIISLVTALLGEKLSLYPFGGRHIMPFAFLLYIPVSYIFAGLYRWTKASIAIPVVLITLLVLFNYCGTVVAPAPLGTWDAQGKLYNYCFSSAKR